MSAAKRIGKVRISLYEYYSYVSLNFLYEFLEGCLIKLYDSKQKSTH